MIDRKRLAKLVFGSSFVLAFMVPAIALAQEPTPVSADWQTSVGKAMAAALAMSVSAFSAGYAQSKIGAAGAGAIAERPESATMIMVLQALPEVIVLLGFVIAFMIK
ncbi:MAG TPA: hypothetical protein VF902_03770 [Coriobacteriia bacterium]